MPEEAYDLYSGTYIKVATDEEIEEALALEKYYFIEAMFKRPMDKIYWIDSYPVPSLLIPPPPIIPILAKPGRALQAYKPGAQPWKRK